MLLLWRVQRDDRVRVGGDVRYERAAGEVRGGGAGDRVERRVQRRRTRPS